MQEPKINKGIYATFTTIQGEGSSFLISGLPEQFTLQITQQPIKSR
jgi:hypothetical protein